MEEESDEQSDHKVFLQSPSVFCQSNSELSELSRSKTKQEVILFLQPVLMNPCAAGASALLPLVPKLMLKLNEEEDEEVLVLLLSTVSCCSREDVLPALASDGVSLLGQKLSHPSPNIRREAAAAMMTLRSDHHITLTLQLL